MNLESLDEVKKLYFKYRLAANRIENPKISSKANRSSVNKAWERKVANWMRRGRIVTQLAPGVWTNADPSTLPRWKAIESEGGTTYVSADSDRS